MNSKYLIFLFQTFNITTNFIFYVVLVFPDNPEHMLQRCQP